MIGKFPYWLVFISGICVASSAIAAIGHRQFELAVLFCFWASIAFSIHGVMKE